ncbi:MAG: type II toxin-antitoxin system HicB family antitoxin [Acidobacteriota bacterium]|nr:type II toxin-antitoxin system HicB family antitoxin [Acidobacteriota bacterium]
MDVTYTAVFEEVPASEGGGYCAYVEELPGANTQGETLDEARENLKDAIRLLLETRRDMLGEEIGNHRIIREKISVSVA